MFTQRAVRAVARVASRAAAVRCYTALATKRSTATAARALPTFTTFQRFFASENVKVPALGDSISEGTVVQWVKSK